MCSQEALDNLMLEGENIVAAARRAIMRHDYSAILTIFPILKHLKMTKPEFDATLQVFHRLRSLCDCGVCVLTVSVCRAPPPAPRTSCPPSSPPWKPLEPKLWRSSQTASRCQNHLFSLSVIQQVY